MWFIAVGDTDGHALVFSGCIKGLYFKPELTLWGLNLFLWCTGNVNETKAWVHGVASRLRVMLSLAWPTMARLGSFVARVNLRVVF